MKTSDFPPQNGRHVQQAPFNGVQKDKAELAIRRKRFAIFLADVGKIEHRYIAGDEI